MMIDLNVKRVLLLVVATAIGSGLGVFISMIVNFALIEISISPLFSMYFGGLFGLVGCLILYRVMSHESSEPLPMKKLHLSIFACLIIFSAFLCFLLDRRMFVGLETWMKVPLYTTLGSAVSFAMTFAIVDVVNYLFGFLQVAVAKPIVESSEQVLLILGISIVMGMEFGMTFGVLDVEDEDKFHVRMALMREEHYSCPAGVILGALGGFGIEFYRQKEDPWLGTSSKRTDFDDDI